jgi:hypothetical protein
MQRVTIERNTNIQSSLVQCKTVNRAEEKLQTSLSSRPVPKKILLDMHDAEREVLKNDLYHIKLTFPWKLHQLLEDVELDGNEHIVSWLPDGKAFKVHKPNGFCGKVMAKYFRQTKSKSFTRQVSSN